MYNPFYFLFAGSCGTVFHALWYGSVCSSSLSLNNYGAKLMHNRIQFFLHLSFAQMCGITFYNDDTDRIELPILMPLHANQKWAPYACSDEHSDANIAL